MRQHPALAFPSHTLAAAALSFSSHFFCSPQATTLSCVHLIPHRPNQYCDYLCRVQLLFGASVCVPVCVFVCVCVYVCVGGLGAAAASLSLFVSSLSPSLSHLVRTGEWFRWTKWELFLRLTSSACLTPQERHHPHSTTLCSAVALSTHTHTPAWMWFLSHHTRLPFYL